MINLSLYKDPHNSKAGYVGYVSIIKTVAVNFLSTTDWQIISALILNMAHIWTTQQNGFKRLVKSLMSNKIKQLNK